MKEIAIGLFFISLTFLLNAQCNVKSEKLGKLSYSKQQDVKGLDLTSFRESSNAKIEVSNRLQKQSETNIEQINTFVVEVLKLEVPENCEVYKKALLQDIDHAKKEYIEQSGGIMFASDIGNILYKAYLQSSNLKLIEKQIKLNELEEEYNKEIADAVKAKKYAAELKVICNSIVPILNELKVVDIDNWYPEFPTTFKFRRGIAVLRFVYNNKSLWG